MANLKQTLIDGSLLVSGTLTIQELTTNSSRVNFFSEKSTVHIGQNASNINLFSNSNSTSSLTVTSNYNRNGPEVIFVNNATSNDTILGTVKWKGRQSSTVSSIVEKATIEMKYLDSSNSSISLSLQGTGSTYDINTILSIGDRESNESIVSFHKDLEAYGISTPSVTYNIGYNLKIGQSGSISPAQPFSYKLCYTDRYTSCTTISNQYWDISSNTVLTFTDGPDGPDTDVVPDGPWYNFYTGNGDEQIVPMPEYKNVPRSYVYIPGSLYCLDPLVASTTTPTFTNTNGEIRIYQSSDDYKSGIKLLYGSTNTGMYFSNISSQFRFVSIGTSETYGTAPSVTLKGYIVTGSSTNMLNFTGQHRVLTDNSYSFEDNNIGKIVVSTGKYCNFDSTNSISIDESLPVVALSDKRRQKNVIGVVSSQKEEDVRTFSAGCFVSYWSFDFKEQGRIVINSIGEGAIWVCDINGNLENGDYITSCEIPGFGMKQDDDFLSNYTVAKITCDCDFDLNSNFYTCAEFEWQGQIYRKALVGCTYHCG